MTNREKYINNASNEELTKILAKSLDRCNFCCLGPEECDGCISQCERRIAYWLSQETEKTADDLFKELGYELDKDSTRSDRTIAVYKDKYMNRVIEIDFNYKEKRDYDFIKTDMNMHAEYINEKEIKAIMKKIEEHKNDKNDWRNKAIEDY